MNKRMVIFAACAAGISVAVLSCNKLPNNIDPRDGNTVYTNCRVKQIMTPAGDAAGSRSRIVLYNSHNNPVSVTIGFTSTTYPNLVFRYDKQDRLIEYSGLYTNNSFEFVHTYGYSHNRIATDTMLVFGAYGVPGSYWNKRIKYLQYDNFNRIEQDSEVNIVPIPETIVFRYLYDQNGNRTSEYTQYYSHNTASASYDNKLNPRRTNTIWMFIDRDYSVNNPAAADTYNSVGLPLIFGTAKNTASMLFGYIQYSGSVEFVYDCR